MSKQQTLGSILGVLGALGGALGNGGECTLWCQAVQMGAGLGENSLLLKFSRSYEHDADLNGARMMAAAGYDVVELANFFEKLKAKQWTAGEPKGLQSWFASHPATGNRIEYVSQDILFYPKNSYSAWTGNFARTKQTAAGIPGNPNRPRCSKPNKTPGRVAGFPRGSKTIRLRDFRSLTRTPGKQASHNKVVVSTSFHRAAQSRVKTAAWNCWPAP